MDDLIEDVNRELERFGEVVSEQLDIVPAKMRVLRHVRGKYRCPSCAGHPRRSATGLGYDAQQHRRCADAARRAREQTGPAWGSDRGVPDGTSGTYSGTRFDRDGVIARRWVGVGHDDCLARCDPGLQIQHELRGARLCHRLDVPRVTVGDHGECVLERAQECRQRGFVRGRFPASRSVAATRSTVAHLNRFDLWGPPRPDRR